MIYELRTYWAAPGKIDALHERFRSLTMELFQRHHLQVIGFWTPAHPTEETGDLIYLLCFENQSQMDAAWQAFQQDPQWIQGKAISEAHGTLVTKIKSVVMTSTPYAPSIV